LLLQSIDLFFGRLIDGTIQPSVDPFYDSLIHQERIFSGRKVTNFIRSLDSGLLVAL
jgi:hypothetical protein